jgi:glutaminyl-tRNA synthetase
VLRKFLDSVGVAKRNNLVDIALLEHLIREDLNLKVPRVMCILHPLKVVIDNYPDGQEEELERLTTRKIHQQAREGKIFGRSISIG